MYKKINAPLNTHDFIAAFLVLLLNRVSRVERRLRKNDFFEEGCSNEGDKADESFKMTRALKIFARSEFNPKFIVNFLSSDCNCL